MAVLGQISEEAISNVRTVKAFANEAAEIAKFRKANQEAYAIGRKSAIVYAFFGGFVQFAMSGCMAGVIYYGAILCKDGKITVGEISAYLLYMIQLVFNFVLVGMVIGQVFKVIGASEKIVKMMQHVPKVNSRGGLFIPDDRCAGELEFRNVSFEYPTKAGAQVLKRVSFKVEQNKVVALVGHSGCGKSTIISLIERFYDPIEGEILFSGVDLRKLDPKWYKRQVAIVAQEPVLFGGTIRENVCYGLDMSSVSEAEIREACRKLNALSFIEDER